MKPHYLQTGLSSCYDARGRETACPGSGQDPEYSPGVAWPVPRFSVHDSELAVTDHLTSLMWTRQANFMDFGLTWSEALEAVNKMNQDSELGFSDWRLPNRRELRSLISHGARKPALPENHPFTGVFLGWYWTSTTAAIAPAYAWYVHLEGGRMFYGKKDGYCLVWPVRGESQVLPVTGQTDCFDVLGALRDCKNSGQDGELQMGRPWPEPRFEVREETVLDNMTGLVWDGNADRPGRIMNWQQALEYTARLAEESGKPWRMPAINELESLVDASCHSPALPRDHPFANVRDGYWSSTTSFFETDWSYVLYLTKGAVGVGHKPGPEFSVWPVIGPG